MPPRDKTNLDQEAAADHSPEIAALLARIEREEIPERLLVLARELQRALDARRAGTVIAADGEDGRDQSGTVRNIPGGAPR